MLVLSKDPKKCCKCNEMFKTFTIQEGEYHCERCGKRYTLCPTCAANTKCSCGNKLDDAWTFNGSRIIY